MEPVATVTYHAGLAAKTDMPHAETYFVYMLASRRQGALYIGMAHDLARRIHQHRAGIGSEHAARYRIWRLVYFERYANVWDAIAREKQMKKWHRAWKIELVEDTNPSWEDLYARLPYET